MSEANDLVAKGFQEYFNSHGFGFQHAVIAEALRAYSKKSPWRYPTPEFPVNVQEANTRVDVILQHLHQPWFIVAECKRANPSLANWCFAGSSIYKDYAASHGLILEKLVFNESNRYAEVIQPTSMSEVYFVSGEVKTDRKGDSHRTGRGAIEEAATQVLRSVNSVAEFLRTFKDVRETMKHAVLVPVIFTTADLYVSETDLMATDLVSGNLELTGALRREKIVIYQYPQSQTFKQLSTSCFESSARRTYSLIPSSRSSYAR